MKRHVVLGFAAMAAGFAFAEGGREAFLQQQAVAEMQRVSGQVDALQNNQEALAGRVAALERKAGSNAEVVALKADLAAVKSSVESLRRAMDAMRSEIVSDLTGRIKKMQAMTPPSPPPAPKKTNKIVYSGPYVEYDVASGDTLSLIAETFGTSVAKIKEMNDLKGSNLRVGQKLKVPKCDAAGKGSSRAKHPNAQ